ncbi:MAG: hypothetical protein NTZ69_10695 [Bacteroidia bacterium]|nr:hypothetical protein [Bacteroidia bacterium]
MKKYDDLFFGLIIGGFFPILLLFLTVIGWFYLDRNEAHIPYYLLTASIAGLAIDLKYLKKWLTRKYELPTWFTVFIYLFYNVMILGFLMGLPLLNPFAGIVAGYYFGRKFQNPETSGAKISTQINRLSLFTALVMTLVCSASGFVGLAGDGAGSEVQHMLHLGFEITRPMLWGITVIGGAGLVLLTVLLTRVTMVWAVGKASPNQISPVANGFAS